MEVAAPWSSLETLYRDVRGALGEGVCDGHMSHAYPDGCSIYFTFAGASPDDADAVATYDRTWAGALRSRAPRGRHRRAPPRASAARSAARWGSRARASACSTRLARAADPRGLLVRGALVPGPNEPVGPGPAAPSGVCVDARSRLVGRRRRHRPPDAARGARATTARPRRRRQGTVRQWLLAHDGPTRDPGRPPRRGLAPVGCRRARRWAVAVAAALGGPDVLPLLLRDARFGSLDGVALRVAGSDERGDAVVACEAALRATDPALTAWLDRGGAEIAT